MSATSHDEPPILTTLDAGVLRVQFNRPKARNAINWEVRRGLRTILDDAARDVAVRAVVLAGDDRAFCSGGDVKEMGNGTTDTAAKLTMAKDLGQLIAEMEKPVVAEVRGYASGAGFGLAMACDFVLIDDTAIFQSVFIARGLVPDFGTTYWLARQVGLHRAKEIILTGRSVMAREAFDLGIAARLWNAAEFREQADAFVASLATAPTFAMGLTKRMLNVTFETDFGAAMDSERLSQLLASTSQEHLAYLASVREAGSARGVLPKS